MSETRKSLPSIDGGRATEDEQVALNHEPETEPQYLETEEVYMQLNQAEVMEAEVPDDSEDHWEHASISLMLDLYLQNIDRFRTPKVKKKNIWNDIGTAIGKNPNCCDKKFRNLKQTYIRLLKKRNRNEITVVKWPYFDVFEQIYCVNGEYNPEITQKVQDGVADVANTLLSMAETSNYTTKCENGETSSGSEEARRKLARRKYTDFKKVTTEMRNRQKAIEDKLDRLLHIVEESNSIQRERNRLFQQFLDSLHQN